MYILLHSQEVLEKDRALIREASQFLVDSIIPQFVRDCIQLSVTPLDGGALKQAMHARGINMRYLGEVAKLAAKREDLQHLQVWSGWWWSYVYVCGVGGGSRTCMCVEWVVVVVRTCEWSGWWWSYVCVCYILA